MTLILWGATAAVPWAAGVVGYLLQVGSFDVSPILPINLCDVGGSRTALISHLGHSKCGIVGSVGQQMSCICFNQSLLYGILLPLLCPSSFVEVYGNLAVTTSAVVGPWARIFRGKGLVALTAVRYPGRASYLI